MSNCDLPTTLWAYAQYTPPATDKKTGYRLPFNLRYKAQCFYNKVEKQV